MSTACGRLNRLGRRLHELLMEDLKQRARLFEPTRASLRKVFTARLTGCTVQLTVCTASITMAIGRRVCHTATGNAATKGRLKVSGAAECASSANLSVRIAVRIHTDRVRAAVFTLVFSLFASSQCSNALFLPPWQTLLLVRVYDQSQTVRLWSFGIVRLPW